VALPDPLALAHPHLGDAFRRVEGELHLADVCVAVENQLRDRTGMVVPNPPGDGGSREGNDDDGGKDYFSFHAVSATEPAGPRATSRRTAETVSHGNFPCWLS
jgi:hypothetical protein